MRFLRPLLAAALLLPASISAQSPASQQQLQEEVRAQVQRLIKATNYEVMETMDMYVRSPRISSVNDERIVRGWNDLYQAMRETAASPGSFFIRLGEIDVTPMGTNHALAVAPMTMDYRTECGPAQQPGSMTLALERTPDGWKILHEHYSTGVDQEAVARMAAQANAGGSAGGLLRLLLMGLSGDYLGAVGQLLDQYGSSCE
ncbi:MAG TPA: nuclear transport factor 2 family protein [Longimicrobium sp.]|nr:nuclear transport factor 2 family protein [Longimicrobium sp.]